MAFDKYGNIVLDNGYGTIPFYSSANGLINTGSNYTLGGLRNNLNNSIWSKNLNITKPSSETVQNMRQQFITDKLNKSNGFLGLSGDTWGTIGNIGLLGIGALNGLLQYGNAQQQLSLAKDMYNTQKAIANRNIANQAKIINNTYDNTAQIAAGMIGGKDANGNYGFVNPDTIKRYEDNARKKYVDGSPV